MKHRLTRLLKVLEWYPRTGAPDVDALALQLGTTPATIRRDLRDLRDAGAFDGAAAELPLPAQPTVQGNLALALAPAPVEPPPVAATTLPERALREPPANDGTTLQPLALTDEELTAMYVGARFLAAEGDPAAAEAAYAVVARVEHLASPALLDRLAEADTRFRFGPRGTDRRVRQLVAQAITERRVLSIRYRGERDPAYRTREVEPLAQFFIHDRWSFVAYCRSAGDIRQFRHERCRDIKLLDQYFTERKGLSLEGFIQQRKRVAAGGDGDR
jgi:predicted DNA-binding transcriptional regulator YafY